MPSIGPVISVVVSAREAGEALSRTLRSVAAQSFPSMEVLVCGPSAANQNWQEAVTDRLVPVTIDTPAYGAGAWHEGLAKASGRYICCLFAGDELDPTYLEKCLFRMETEGYDAGSTDEEIPDVMPHICVVRTRVLRDLGGYDVRSAPERQRLHLVRRLTLRGSMITTPEVLACAADAPDRPAETVPPPSIGAAQQLRFSYAPLIGGPRPESPVVLLAMPYLARGGGEAIVSQLCRQLKRLGYRILVYTTVPVMESEDDTTEWFRDSAAAIYHLPVFLEIEHWPTFIAYLVQQHGASILWQVGSSFTYDLLPQLRELFPHLAVVDLLFNPVGHTANYLRYDYLIDHVVTEHEGMKNWLMERGESPDQVSVIPNGVDLEAYSPRPKLDWRTRQPRAAGEGPFVAAFLGRLSKEKAPDIFLEIAARMAEDRDIEFLVCGTGPMAASLNRDAETRGLSHRVHFLGFVSNREFLPCCDAVVVCSRLDGRPNLVMESLAMGVPVIASRVGGIPEMMPPEEDDLLCEVADSAAFAAAIRRLADDPERYRRSSEKARRHAEERFSIADSGHMYAHLFEELRRKRQPLDRRLPAELVASQLGYEEEGGMSALPALAVRLWRAYSPASLLVDCGKNAALYWRIRRDGQGAKVLNCFDPAYYMRQYPETKKWKISPLWHYILYGFREGRNPSPGFDTRYYLTAYPDVRRTGVNPLLHFVMWGEREGRFTTQRPAAKREWRKRGRD